MEATETRDPLTDNISRILTNFTAWLDAYGETSWDHQSFFAGAVGSRVKALYYRRRGLGPATVAPMVFSEADQCGVSRLFVNKRLAGSRPG